MRKYALEPVGERSVLATQQRLDGAAYSVSVITGVDNPQKPVLVFLIFGQIQILQTILQCSSLWQLPLGSLNQGITLYMIM